MQFGLIHGQDLQKFWQSGELQNKIGNCGSTKVKKVENYNEKELQLDLSNKR